MIISNKKQFIIFFLILILIILTIVIHFFKVSNSNYEVLESENILENAMEFPQNNLLENNLTNSLGLVDNNNNDNNDDDNFIVVHVTGAIHNPGIVKLLPGARIADAINSAGGFTDDSDISSINLAYKLEDGEKIYIPYISNSITNKDIISSDAGENVILESFSNSSTSTSSNNVDLVNINSATQTELETIPGIGPSTALKIIEYRSQNGKFTNISDIMNVNGIGEAKYNSIKSYITIK